MSNLTFIQFCAKVDNREGVIGSCIINNFIKAQVIIIY